MTAPFAMTDDPADSNTAATDSQFLADRLAVVSVSPPARRDEIAPGTMTEAMNEGLADVLLDVVQVYQQRLLNYAWRLLGDEATAEDVVQEAFVNFYRRLPDFIPIRHLTALLYRIVTNGALNAKRSLRRRREVSLEASTPLAADQSDTGLGLKHVLADGHASGVSDQAIVEELRAVLREALDAVAPRQRSAWVLRILEHHAYEDIADILDVTVSNAEVLVHRAGKKLCEHPALRAWLEP